MLFSAHRIEAQFSSPVRVMNTSSAPAIASVIDERARIPYDSVQLLPNACTGAAFCNITFGAIPANHRLVVQHVSGNLTVTGANAMIVDLLCTNCPAFTYSSFFSPTAGGISAFDAPVLAYFDVGVQPNVFVAGNTFTGTNAGTITLSGYMIDCSAAPCAAIAH
jgi:hypothetical protein